MEQTRAPDLHTAFQGGKSGSGPIVKRPRFTKKAPPAVGNTSKSPAKRKGTSLTTQTSTVTEKRIPHPPPPPRFTSSRDQVIQADPPAPPAPAATVRILVDPQDLEKIPEAFWGILYETASHMVGHAYRATLRDLRMIEEQCTENVLESSLGMTFTSTLAQHRSIARARARNDELQAKLNAHQDRTDRCSRRRASCLCSCSKERV
ncbi:uncharacterized protein LOC133784364 [Humulus lupulus]|uniref:uncharacterized protein LOC133784364 n=1 Tax=Humulus lupulus TaxID=3486 RepID=UPI002B40CF48|nr:uncharacterized protein LOC133784364 [Humulus lupulus]